MTTPIYTDQAAKDALAMLGATFRELHQTMTYTAIGIRFGISSTVVSAIAKLVRPATTVVINTNPVVKVDVTRGANADQLAVVIKSHVKVDGSRTVLASQMPIVITPRVRVR